MSLQNNKLMSLFIAFTFECANLTAHLNVLEAAPGVKHHCCQLLSGSLRDSLDESKDYKRAPTGLRSQRCCRELIISDRKATRVKTWTDSEKLWSLWIERRFFWSVASVDNELFLLWSLSICVCVCVSLSLWWSVFLHLVLISFNFSWYFLSAVASKFDTDFVYVCP